MEENIVIWLELRDSVWNFQKLPLQASACSLYVG